MNETVTVKWFLWAIMTFTTNGNVYDWSLEKRYDTRALCIEAGEAWMETHPAPDDTLLTIKCLPKAVDLKAEYDAAQKRKKDEEEK